MKDNGNLFFIASANDESISLIETCQEILTSIKEIDRSDERIPDSLFCALSRILEIVTTQLTQSSRIAIETYNEDREWGKHGQS